MLLLTPFLVAEINSRGSEAIVKVPCIRAEALGQGARARIEKPDKFTAHLVNAPHVRGVLLTLARSPDSFRAWNQFHVFAT